MPSVTFPFQSRFQRKIEATERGQYDQTPEVTVTEDVVVEIRDLSDDPTVSVVLDAKDQSGDHRIVRTGDGGLYSAVFQGTSDAGTGGRMSGDVFSCFKPSTWKMSPVGSRILVEGPAHHLDTASIESLDEREARSHERDRTRFLDRMKDVVRIDGVLYLPTTSLPSIALKGNHRHESMIVLVDSQQAIAEHSNDRLRDNEMLLPWSVAELVAASDHQDSLLTFDVRTLSTVDLPHERYTELSNVVLERIVHDLELELAGKSSAYLRLYADVRDAVVDGKPEMAWQLLTSDVISNKLSFEARIRVEMGAILTSFPAADEALEEDRVHEAMHTLNHELASIVSKLEEPRPELNAAMIKAAQTVHAEDQIGALQRLADEAAALTRDLRHRGKPLPQGVAKALVQVDHVLSVNARQDVEAVPSPTRQESPSPM